MKTFFGVLLGFFTFSYWYGLLTGVSRVWRVLNSKELASAVYKNIPLEKAKTAAILILGGIFGLLLIKWSAQLLGIVV